MKKTRNSCSTQYLIKNLRIQNLFTSCPHAEYTAYYVLKEFLFLEQNITSAKYGPKKRRIHKRLHNFCLLTLIILTLILLMWRIGWAPNSIPIYSYIQQHATLHSLFTSGNCSICFEWYFHPSSGAHTTLSTASGICHTVTAICRYRGRVGTGLSVLWMAYATHSTLKPVPTLPR
jgi:hypothetical protein